MNNSYSSSSLFHTRSIPEVFTEFNSGPQGLTELQVRERFLLCGPNIIPSSPRPGFFLLFLKQFKSLLVLILIISAGLSFALGRPVDGYLIIAVLMLNAVLGYTEERKSRNALAGLERLLLRTAQVLRGEEVIKIDVAELVPGDVIYLRAGDSVPADARVFEAKGLEVNESALTGESLPVSKDVAALPESTMLSERNNMLYAGTNIFRGEARALVVATGRFTVIGELAFVMRATPIPPTYFERAVRLLGVQMSFISFLGACLIFLSGYLGYGQDFFSIFLFSLASLVSGIPEGLPVMLTIVLAVAAQAMARRNAIVRELPAVETLGVATRILTDKTGTLTENALTIECVSLANSRRINVSGSGLSPTGSFSYLEKEFRPLSDADLRKLIRIGLVCNSSLIVRNNSGYEVFGEVTEAAFIVLGEKAGLTKAAVLDEEPVSDELVFQEDRKYRAVLARVNGGEIYVLGAAERLLSLSEFSLDGGALKPLTQSDRRRIVEEAERLSGRGMRVLACAYRPFTSSYKIDSNDIKSLSFVGIVGERDTVRPEVPQAMLLARRLGLKIHMVTGDHPLTARAIAKESELTDDPEPRFITEQELSQYSDAELASLVSDVPIFARVTPASKLRILRAFQANGEIVAMTGDGVNDAPALRASDIGVSMGRRGTDSAREASSIVLLDDNFATIVYAIEEGRLVHRNVRLVSSYLIITCIAEFGTILTSFFFGFPLPLLPVHLLWLNLITDGIGSLPLAFERSHESGFREPVRRGERILSLEILPFMLICVVLMIVGTLFFYMLGLSQSLEKAWSMAFTSMAFFQLWNMWNMRSLSRSVFEIGILKNRFAVAAFLVSVVFQLAVIQIPFFAKLFSFESLSILEWISIVLVTSSVFWCGELYKVFRAYLRRS